ncbi:MAG: hypothetical protein Q9183_003346 [Haloplaca sp. 2 TL-2023]
MPSPDLEAAEDSHLVGQHHVAADNGQNPLADTDGVSDQSDKATLQQATRDLADLFAHSLHTALEQIRGGTTNIPLLATGEEPAVVGATDTHLKVTPRDPLVQEGQTDHQNTISQDTLAQADAHGAPATQVALHDGEDHRELQSYRVEVKTSSEVEIQAENQRRQNIRNKWRAKERSYLEDSWQPLWRQETGVETGLFQWPCSDNERKDLQLDLVDGLCFAMGNMRWVKNGIRGMSCWISLIGIRLNGLCSQKGFPKKSPSQTDAIEHEMHSPLKQARILIECIWVCNNNRNAAIGDVLLSCYRRHVLRQPALIVNLADAKRVAQRHIRAVRIAIYLVSIVYRLNFPELNENEDLDAAWGMAISSAEVRLRRKVREIDTDAGKSPFIAVGDFNLRDLRNIGQLRIQWTSYWDEHLELQTTWAENILKLYWFHPLLSRNLFSKSVHQIFSLRSFQGLIVTLDPSGLCGGISGIERHETTVEIFETLSLILSSGVEETEAKVQYQTLEAPLVSILLSI